MLSLLQNYKYFNLLKFGHENWDGKFNTDCFVLRQVRVEGGRGEGDSRRGGNLGNEVTAVGYSTLLVELSKPCSEPLFWITE